MAGKEYMEGSFKGRMLLKGYFDIKRPRGSQKKYENSTFRKKMRKNDLVVSPTLRGRGEEGKILRGKLGTIKRFP